MLNALKSKAKEEKTTIANMVRKAVSEMLGLTQQKSKIRHKLGKHFD
jgi:hypothetical protein